MRTHGAGSGAAGADGPPTAGRIGPRAAGDAGPLRVILVGRTGLEAALRVDPTIELVRARAATDAIGELAEPLDDQSPAAATVVLGDGAVAETRSAALVEALRLVQADVRVLSVGRELEGVDGTIPAHADLASLSVLLRRPVGEMGAVPGAGAAGVGVGVSRLVKDAEAASGQNSGADRLVLAALLAGKDATATAVGIVSSRLKTQARVLGVGGAGDSPPAQARPLVHAGRTVGHLAAQGADLAALGEQCEWLAPWVVLIAQQEQLRRAAFTDELTGAWNRRYFLRYLNAAIEQARAARHTVTLLYFDVDNFKTYNDAHGHSAGDEILVETIRLMNACIRPSDRVCRIGGDEFGVIFHDPEGPRKPGALAQGPSSIGSIIERFQKQIREHRFPKLSAGAHATLTISGGMATFPWDGRSAQELIDRADELAGQSKRVGKNAITFGPGAERECRGEQAPTS